MAMEARDAVDDDLAYFTKKYGGTFRKVQAPALGVVRPDGRIAVRFVVLDYSLVSEPDETNGTIAKSTADESTDR